MPGTGGTGGADGTGGDAGATALSDGGSGGSSAGSVGGDASTNASASVATTGAATQDSESGSAAGTTTANADVGTGATTSVSAGGAATSGTTGSGGTAATTLAGSGGSSTTSDSSVSSTTTSGGVPVSYLQVDGGIYRLVTEPATWLEAQEDCANDATGAHLVIIDSIDEHYTIHAFSSSVSEVWLGYTDRVFEGTFLWVGPGGLDPVATSACFWGSGPDNSEALDCAVQDSENACPDWWLVNCDEPRAYVCEFDGTASDPNRY